MAKAKTDKEKLAVEQRENETLRVRIAELESNLPAPPTRTEKLSLKTGFALKNGTVVATQVSGEKADEFRKNSHHSGKKKYDRDIGKVFPD